MTKLLCIYHGNCADGFTSAWVVRRYFNQRGVPLEFHAGVYQDAPPDVTGMDVLLVDFSYKKAVLDEMAAKANSILVLDHHKTAAADLAHAAKAGSTWDAHMTNVYQDRCEGVRVSLYALFDMERSGAGIVWDYFFPHMERPSLVSHVEDRDLWRFNLPFTREIQAAVFSYPYDFDVWQELVDSFDTEGNTRLSTEGAAIERKHHKDIAELTKVVTRPMKIRAPWLDGPAPADLGFVAVPMANLPYTLTSDAGHLLCGTQYPFAGCYWDTPNGRVFSLRSRDDGADVGEVAKQYGGGGHAHASGFRVPFDQLAQFECSPPTTGVQP
jgi:uncharacterized protein